MTTPPPPPGPPHPPAPPWGAPPPPPAAKPRRKLWPWLLGGAAVFLLLLGGCGALLASIADEAAKTPAPGSRSTPLATAEATPSETADGIQETTPPPPEPAYTPTAKDFRIAVKVVSRQCFGSAGCLVSYRVAPTYVGKHPLSESVEYEVTYEVRGVDDGPAVNTFTVTGGESSVQSEETAQTPSSTTKLSAVATDVVET